jgi:DNA repair protein RadA/Sms
MHDSDMAKAKTRYQCTSCGSVQPKWLGRCPDCGSWNTFEEVTGGGGGSAAEGGSRGPRNKKVGAISLDSIRDDEGARISTGIGELDTVLGGGLMRGGSVLIGGEPGIGKSTLLLQAAAGLPESATVLYVSGEESPKQIKLRARRLGIDRKNLEVLHTGNLDDILRVLRSRSPDVLLVDSIQTLVSDELGAVPGTVNQIKYCSLECISWAREREGAVLFVAHVTKEGAIAGPKVVEHMVDTVLYFEHGVADLRLVKPSKNRFGTVDEIGIFTMTSGGLKEVAEPSSYFLTAGSGGLPPGVAVAPVYEGSRVLMVEIQALVVPAKGSFSRVFSERIESGRVSRIAAVLEKHLSIRFSDQDIYINVAGGIRLSETGIDLPLSMALYSARIDTPVPKAAVFAGEISLAGEVRPASHLERRIKTSYDLGFDRFYTRGAAQRKATTGVPGSAGASAPGGVSAEALVPVRDIAEAVRKVFAQTRSEER